MKRNHFWPLFALMVVIQVIVCNFAPPVPYMTVSILPALILLLPIGFHTFQDLLLAFVAGILVDLLSDGIPGLNVAALLPVAFLRRSITILVFGKELYARDESVSLEKHGTLKLSVAILIVQFIFFIIYIFIDAAGTRTLWFCLLWLVLSMATSYPVAFLAASCLTKKNKSGWN